MLGVAIPKLLRYVNEMTKASIQLLDVNARYKISLKEVNQIEEEQLS